MHLHQSTEFPLALPSHLASISVNRYVRDAAEVAHVNVAARRKELVKPLDGVLVVGRTSEQAKKSMVESTTNVLFPQPRARRGAQVQTKSPRT